MAAEDHPMGMKQSLNLHFDQVQSDPETARAISKHMTILKQKEQILTDGFCYLDTALNPVLVEKISQLGHQYAQNIRQSLGEKEIGIGSALGYHEIVQRSPGRWDIPISPERMGVSEYTQHWMELVRAILGTDAQFTFSGIVTCDPNQPSQNWHIDSPHQHRQHLGPHALNVVVALHDIELEMGPTKFAVGSQRISNQLKYPSLKRKKLIYQNDGTTPEYLAQASQQPIPRTHTQRMESGSSIVFDDRVLHRGGANSSDQQRTYAYFSYCKKSYTENTHFEATRSVNDPA